MFKRKYKIEVVPPHEYTDFSDRDPSLSQFATKRTVAVAAVVPAVVSIALLVDRLNEAHTAVSIPVTAPVIEPTNVVMQSPTMLPVNITASHEMIPTGFIADSSLEMLATVLDPLVQIMMAISFPIASVIMIGGSFFFLLGNSERAWSTIFNAALGYIIIQMSPLFLQILRTIGESV